MCHSYKRPRFFVNPINVIKNVTTFSSYYTGKAITFGDAGNRSHLSYTHTQYQRDHKT